ncbi:MAG: D-aminoacyl-tRNA deacylase [Bacteroidota bacterium]|nr:D-aminoacyl-tRNA deacylase [Bacteroidota bacterium]MDP3144982.1 D-aminoacyl-tRNA deacylase [Bacteroidota bacterium]MDP3556014.1 D-aminoacyl-tRNA deacylase [Bacteroidota bacterium]
MRIVLQRVQKAIVNIENKLYSSIGRGYFLLVGIENEDTHEDIMWLVSKILGLRIFADEEGKMNLDIKQIDGEILIVSQFTLHASTKKGNRPSFIKAARPEVAIPLYEKFIEEIDKLNQKSPKTGVFGADMQIELINDGPVTIILDSKNKE